MLRVALVTLFLLMLFVWFMQNRGHYYVVVDVHDGDTITVQEWKNKHLSPAFSVRLDGADSPEMWQPGKDGEQAKKSRKALHRQVIHQRVVLRDCHPDLYKRTVCTVYFRGMNVSAWLIKKGLAYEYKEYSGGKYEKQEENAKFFRKGVWSYAGVKPWDARADRRAGK